MAIKVTKLSSLDKIYRKKDKKYCFVVEQTSSEIQWKPYKYKFGEEPILLEINEREVELNKLVYYNRTFTIKNREIVYAVLNDYLYEIQIPKGETYSQDELTILVKEKIYRENKKFEQIKKQVEAYEKFESNPQPEKRQPIPEDVKFEVWRRDGGKCVMCGSQKNLEFDHIIPFSKGGSSTARNIQLLCQECNRKKSNKI